jgi:hypothetical protein
VKDQRDAASQLAQALARLGSEGDVDAEGLRTAIEHELSVIQGRETTYAGGPGQNVACTIERVWAERCGGNTGGQVIYRSPIDAGPSRDPIGAGGSACTPCVNGWRVCIDYACRLEVQG